MERLGRYLKKRSQKAIAQSAAALISFSTLAGCSNQYHKVPSYIPEYENRKPNINWDGNIRVDIRNLINGGLVESGQFRMPEVDDTLDKLMSTYGNDANRVVRYCLDEAYKNPTCSGYYTIDWPEDYGLADLDESDDWNWHPLERAIIIACNTGVNACLKEQLVNPTILPGRRLPKPKKEDPITILPPPLESQQLNFHRFSPINTLQVVFATNDLRNKLQDPAKTNAIINQCVDQATNSLSPDTKKLFENERKKSQNPIFWAYSRPTENGYYTYVLRRNTPRQPGQSLDEDMFTVKNTFLECLKDTEIK